MPAKGCIPSPSMLASLPYILRVDMMLKNQEQTALELDFLTDDERELLETIRK